MPCSRTTSRIAVITARVVDHLDQRLLLLRHQHQPGVTAPVQMQHLPKPSPPLPPPPVTSSRPTLLDQTRTLQKLLHAGIRQLHPMLSPDRGEEVPGVEARVPLPIQLQDPLDLHHRRPPRRRSAPPHVHKPLVAEPLHPLPQPPQTPRGDPQNLRRPKPAVLLVHRPKQHFLDLHRPLHGRGRNEHRRLPDALLLDPAPGPKSGQFTCSKERTDHVLSTNDRDLLDPSGVAPYCWGVEELPNRVTLSLALATVLVAAAALLSLWLLARLRRERTVKARLASSEARFRQLGEAADDVIFRTDAEGR